jgi:hypothetical protein
MKTPKPLLVVSLLALAMIIVTLSGCKKTEMIPLTGTITDTDGNPVPEGKVSVYVWNEDAKEPVEVIYDFKDGRLGTELPAKGKKYVVNIRAKGYGLVSKVYYAAPPESKFQLKKATVVSITPGTGGTVTDNGACPGSMSFKANWTQNPLAGVPIQIAADGKIAGFGMPKELNDAWLFHAKSPVCNNGITVNFPANSIAAPAAVSVSMSAIDVFSPDGMPGDNSADFGSGLNFMESFGAFSLDIYDNEKFYNLNREKGGEATVTFPAGLFPSKDIPKSVPILSYNEKSGVWEKESEAQLDSAGKMYVAKVSHFSAINFDIEKTTPSCLRFKDRDDNFDPPYSVELTIAPTGGGLPVVNTRTINTTDLCTDANNDRQFALTRLPENTSASVVFFTGNQPKAVYVVRTPPTNPLITDGSHPTCAELNVLSPLVCGNFTEIDESVFSGFDIIVAACRDGADITISIASKNAINPADYQLKITQGTCGETVTLNDAAELTLLEQTTANPPLVNFQLLKYRRSGCGSPSLDESVEVVLTSTATTMSNVFFISPSCSL